MSAAVTAATGLSKASLAKSISSIWGKTSKESV